MCPWALIAEKEEQAFEHLRPRNLSVGWADPADSEVTNDDSNCIEKTRSQRVSLSKWEYASGLVVLT